jgi:hypothetical protein
VLLLLPPPPLLLPLFGQVQLQQHQAMALSTAKQWEVLNTTLGKAVGTSDEDFPAMVIELVQQCQNLTCDNPPKATWKKLLQQNVSSAAGAATPVHTLPQVGDTSYARFTVYLTLWI